MRLDSIKPQIIGLTEIKAKNQIYEVSDTEFEINNFDMFMNNKPKRGIIMYFDKKLNARECSELNNSQFDESLWCSYKGAQDETVLVGCIYHSPNSSEENTKLLFNLLKHEEISKYNKILIMGDFNYPDIKWDGSWSGERNNMFVECLRDIFLIQKVTKPTRHRDGQRSTVDDLILVSEDNLISDISHLDPLGKSDHDILVFDLYIPLDKPVQHQKYRFKLEKGDYDKFRQFVMEKNFNNNGDVEELWGEIKDTILQGMEKYIPKIKINDNKKIKPLWMTQKVVKSVKKKYNLYKKFLKTKKGEDYEKYKSTRNKCGHIIKKARKNFERIIAENCKKSPKKFWKYVQERSKSNIGVSALKDGHGNFAVSDSEKAELLNSFFSSVFTIENLTNIPDMECCSKSSGIAITDIRVTAEAVKTKLKELDSAKAQGPDGIPPRVLKELAEELSIPMAKLFNKSLETGFVPTDWKNAEVTAIFKKGSRSEPGNYRPVSLTCITCKILESFIRDSIVSHFIDNNLFSNCQHGFRAKRSCVTQLMEVMEDLTASLDDKNPVDVVYFDFRKAFDSVPHERLLLKMEAYGIVGTVLRWVRNFLTGREQKVRLGDERSSTLEVVSGIPQGSILGPILFLIFINDLPENITSSCKIFADDTKIYGRSKDSDAIQKDIDSLQLWTDKWNLYFNVEKCKVMHIGKNNQNNNYYMKIGVESKLIITSTEEKDLGVIFDTTLSFDPHMENCINKANRMIGLIKRTFVFINKDIFIKLYKALVRPHLEYGNIIWSPLLKRQSIAIERVQRRATKILVECKDMSYCERLLYLNLHSLKGRRLRGDLIETFKIFNHINDLSWSHFFASPDCNITRQSEGKIFIEYARTNLRKNVFSNRIANLWNNLPTNLKYLHSTNSFKNQLDKIPKFEVLFRSFDE